MENPYRSWGGNADWSSSNTTIDECVSVLKTLVTNNSNTSNNTVATNTANTTITSKLYDAHTSLSLYQTTM